jgi:hypothetical protein
MKRGVVIICLRGSEQETWQRRRATPLLVRTADVKTSRASTTSLRNPHWPNISFAENESTCSRFAYLARSAGGRLGWRSLALA